MSIPSCLSRVSLYVCVLALCACVESDPKSLAVAQVDSSVSGASINTYGECRAAGYVVMKTMPARCRTPDGRVFIEGRIGPVEDVLLHGAVSSFDECVAAGNAIRKTLPASCVTNDGKIFEDRAREQGSPTDIRTGQRTCVNKCGDGHCAEMVCMAIGCPCAETHQSCPADCK